MVLGAVGADVARRAFAESGRHRTASEPAVETAAVLGGRSAAVPDTAVNAAARRDRTRERLREENERTYLAESLTDTDSMLRRWPDARITRPLRIAIVRQNVDGFREDFVGNVNWAISRWNGVVPVQLETGADSATADIVVTWTVRMDSNRTGRTDLTWDRRGNIRQALIVLATHTPEGQLLDTRRMAALALHEVGHAMGLGHSPVKQDALYPVTLAQELSDRDIRTARLLYDLPAGSVR